MAELSGKAFDMASFEEVDASPAPSDGGVGGGGGNVSEVEALKECADAIAKSEDLCQRLDPEEEPFRSKYLAREALRIAMAKIAPHANLRSKAAGSSSGGGGGRKKSSDSLSYFAAGPGGSEAAKVAVARLQWRIGAICMEVEESGAAEGHLSAALKQWRPRVVEVLARLAEKEVAEVKDDSKSKNTKGDELAALKGDDDDRDMMVSELVEYCRERSRHEAASAGSKKGKAGQSPSTGGAYALEIIDAMSHLGIFHHNFEHVEEGLVLLKLCEELIRDLSGTEYHVRTKKVPKQGAKKKKTKKKDGAGNEDKEQQPEAGGGEEKEDSSAVVPVLSDAEWAMAEDGAKALSVHTHVVFYLAQAFAALRLSHEAAEYCKTTLEMQLVQEESNQYMRQLAMARAGSGGGGGGGAAAAAGVSDETEQAKGNLSSDPFSTASHRATWSMSAGSAAGKGYGSKLDPKEWYQNCAGLVDYYTGQGRYRDAEHCLRACDAIIAKYMQVPPPPATPQQMANVAERLEEAEADMHRRWGVFYLNVLQEAARYTEAARRLVEEGKMTAEEAHLGRRDPQRDAEELPLKVDFRPLGILSLEEEEEEEEGEGDDDDGSDEAAQKEGKKQTTTTTTKPKKQKKRPTALPCRVYDFETARGLFKLATARHAKAKKYYVLDGFVTDHVALCRDTSSMYRWLATYETDEKRKTAMYLRRVNELAPLAAELGRQAYLDTIKQLRFEIGEIWMEMTEMKQGRLEKKVEANPAYRPKEAEITKSNEYCQASIDAFIEFTELFRKQPPPNPLFPVAAQTKKDGASDDDDDDSDDSDDGDGIVADAAGGFETTTKMTAEEREAARRASERRRKARREAKKAKKKEEEFPLEVEPADLGLHLRAHFYVARMHGKLLALPAEQGEKRVKGLRASLKKFEWLQKFARERIAKVPKPKDKATAAASSVISFAQDDEPYTDPDTIFKDELAMVDQMVELLPQQINRVFYQNANIKG